MTVEQNIGAGIQEQKNKKTDIIRKMIETFCLSGLERHYPVQLSGGEQQRVALARILASDTELLLLDEPFSALDYYLKEQMIEQLFVLMKGYQKDVILVTHDRDEAFSLCPDLIIMDNGRLICQGDLKEIFDEPKTLTAARLTGCKNFSKAVKVSEHELFASDWNLTLWVEQIIPDSINYIGIRAHYFKSTVSSYDCKNLIEPELVEVIESPFEVNVLFIRCFIKTELAVN
jgi:molybdate transport system ATP-binding protein